MGKNKGSSYIKRFNALVKQIQKKEGISWREAQSRASGRVKNGEKLGGGDGPEEEFVAEDFDFSTTSTAEPEMVGEMVEEVAEMAGGKRRRHTKRRRSSRRAGRTMRRSRARGRGRGRSRSRSSRRH